MKLNHYYVGYTQEEFLDIFYYDCVVHKYLEEAEVKVLQAIVNNCDETGYGVLDLESLSTVIKMNEDDLVGIINDKLLDKILFGVSVLEIVEEKQLLGDTVYIIYSELAVCN